MNKLWVKNAIYIVSIIFIWYILTILLGVIWSFYDLFYNVQISIILNFVLFPLSFYICWKTSLRIDVWKMKDNSFKLPGFRTKKLWKELLSLIYYTWIFVITIIFCLSYATYGTISRGLIINAMFWYLFGKGMFWLMKELPKQQKETEDREASS